MIRIKAAYIGNGGESFIEDGFTDGINIIFSDDNNRGKTILMQGMMYTLGAVPVFPEKFNYRDYLYIVDLDVNGTPLSVLRKRNTFAVLDDKGLSTFVSESEFSRYWSTNIAELPNIVKDGRLTLVGLELYTQMAFVGQDDNSSASINAGRFKKPDFIEMLYAIAGLDGRCLDSQEIAELKNRRDELKGRVNTLVKQEKILNSRGTALSLVSAATDRRDMEELAKKLEASRIEMSDLRKTRSRLLIRKTKNQVVLDELRAIKREIKGGELTCLDCGSHRIGYIMAESDLVFDVSSPEMRTQIEKSLKDRISDISAEIEDTERDIRSCQSKMSSYLRETEEYSFADLIACREDYLSAQEVDDEIQRAQAEIDEIKDKLEADKVITRETQQQRKEFSNAILSKMNFARKTITGTTDEPPYERLFGSRSNVFSGSDGTVYFASRCYALSKVLTHGLPILIDSFRADELSTEREDRLLDLFTQLDNQMILTATIKKQEGHLKYGEDERVFAIDYSKHRTNKLLTSDYNDAFRAKAAEFNLILD